jgi:hypothetical protein
MGLDRGFLSLLRSAGEPSEWTESIVTGFLRGALAGAAGTTALNAITYLDLVLRARPTSSTPEQLVDKISAVTNLDIPGAGEERQNRVAGLAPLLGIGVGAGVGSVAGAIHHLLLGQGRRLPFLVGAALVGASAMAASDVPLMLSGVSDPKSWTSKDWLADALPHLAYGVVTEAAIRLTE